MKKLLAKITKILYLEPSRESASVKELESELAKGSASVRELESKLMKELASVKELESELMKELASVKELAKKNRTTFWTSILLAVFSLCVAIGNSYLVVDLTEKKSEEKESLTVLKLLSNAENDAYKARTLIYEREELDKSQGNSDSLVDMANQWNESGARLPYPEALAMAINDKSVRMKLSQTGSINFNDYKEQLDKNRSLIMNPNTKTISKAFIYTSYKRDLQDLTNMLQQEIRFQNSEIGEEDIARFYMVLEDERVEYELKDMKEIERINHDLSNALLSQK